MRANLTLMFFAYLVAVFAWRHVSKALEVQRAIHRAHLGLVLQWYALLLVGCAAMVAWTLHEFLGSYFGLDSSQVLLNLKHAHATSKEEFSPEKMSFDEFQRHFQIPALLQRFSVASNLAGVLVVLLATAHIFSKFAYPGMRIVQAREDFRASSHPWWPAPRMNRLITLMLMPAMLSVMSMRGSCRIWALCTGQAESHFRTSFEKIEKWEIALYHMDQEVGQMFQFLSVYAFCRICGSLLNESLGEVAGAGSATTASRRDLVDTAKELRRLVRTAGFLAVWVFIAVGILRCLLEFLVAESHYYEFLEESSSALEASVLKAANTIFSFLTIMCVLNMFIVGRTKTIKDSLGNTNLKFMGARLLLLIIAVQEQAAQALTLNSEVHSRLVEKAGERGHDISGLGLTALQADLLHLSLLNFECLFVVVFNVFVWRDLDLVKSGIANYGHDNSASDDVEAPPVNPGAESGALLEDGERVDDHLGGRAHSGAPLLLGSEGATQSRQVAPKRATASATSV